MFTVIERAGLLRQLDSLFLDQQQGQRAQINDLMGQKYRLYYRQLFDASINIGRHTLIRTDVVNEAFVIQKPVSSRSAKPALKITKYFV
jgi:hypothetical protein